MPSPYSARDALTGDPADTMNRLTIEINSPVSGFVVAGFDGCLWVAWSLRVA